MKVKKLLIVLTVILSYSGVNYAKCLTGNCYDFYGIYSYEDGTLYEGFWNNYQPDGPGIMTYGTSNLTQVGIWDDGEFKESLDIKNIVYAARDSLASYYNDSKESPWEILDSINNFNKNQEEGATTSIDPNENRAVIQEDKKGLTYIFYIITLSAPILMFINNAWGIRDKIFRE